MDFYGFMLIFFSFNNLGTRNLFWLNFSQNSHFSLIFNFYSFVLSNIKISTRNFFFKLPKVPTRKLDINQKLPLKLKIKTFLLLQKVITQKKTYIIIKSIHL